MSNLIVVVAVGPGVSLEDAAAQVAKQIRERCGSDVTDQIQIQLTDKPEVPAEPQYGDVVEVWIGDRQDLYAEEAVIALKRLGIINATIDIVRGVNVNYPLCVGEYRLTESLEDLVADINDEQGAGEGLAYIGRVPEDHVTYSNEDRDSIQMFTRLQLQPVTRLC